MSFRQKVEETEVHWEQIEHSVSFYFDGKSYYVPLGTRHLLLMERIEEISEVEDTQNDTADEKGAILTDIGTEANNSDLDNMSNNEVDKPAFPLSNIGTEANHSDLDNMNNYDADKPLVLLSDIGTEGNN